MVIAHDSTCTLYRLMIMYITTKLAIPTTGMQKKKFLKDFFQLANIRSKFGLQTGPAFARAWQRSCLMMQMETMAETVHPKPWPLHKHNQNLIGSWGRRPSKVSWIRWKSCCKARQTLKREGECWDLKRKMTLEWLLCNMPPEEGTEKWSICFWRRMLRLKRKIRVERLLCYLPPEEGTEKWSICFWRRMLRLKRKMTLEWLLCNMPPEEGTEKWSICFWRRVLRLKRKMRVERLLCYLPPEEGTEKWSICFWRRMLRLKRKMRVERLLYMQRPKKGREKWSICFWRRMLRLKQKMTLEWLLYIKPISGSMEKLRHFWSRRGQTSVPKIVEDVRPLFMQSMNPCWKQNLWCCSGSPTQNTGAFLFLLASFSATTKIPSWKS